MKEFKNLFHHEKNNTFYIIVLAFFLLSLMVYSAYFDILITGFPDGSYRKQVGELFVIPSLLLAFGQIFIGGFVMKDPGYILPLEILYTTFMILASSYLIRRFYGMELKTSMFVAMTILLGITVAAS